MKKLLISMFVAFITATTAHGQTEDVYGRKVTQTATQYTVTYKNTTENGGTASEKWSGPLSNGKRTGTWTFSATYQRYYLSKGTFLTGTQTIARNYKDGKPHGTYSVVSTLKECDGRYNYFTNEWVYGPYRDYGENVKGSFVEGKPSGTWNISSKRNKNQFILYFTNGHATGTWNIQNPGKSTIEFNNEGYVIHQKTVMAPDWGFELKYSEGADLKTILPNDTTYIGDYLHFFGYYQRGCGMEEYLLKYPENEENEMYEPYYITAAYQRYYAPYGNAPEYEVRAYEQKLKKWEDIQNILPDIEYASEALKDFVPYTESTSEFFRNLKNREYVTLQKALEIRERYPNINPYIKDIYEIYFKNGVNTQTIKSYYYYLKDSVNIVNSYKKDIDDDIAYLKKKYNITYPTWKEAEKAILGFRENWKAANDSLTAMLKKKEELYNSKIDSLKNLPLTENDYVAFAITLKNPNRKKSAVSVFHIPYPEEVKFARDFSIDCLRDEWFEELPKPRIMDRANFQRFYGRSSQMNQFTVVTTNPTEKQIQKIREKVRKYYFSE